MAINLGLKATCVLRQSSGSRPLWEPGGRWDLANWITWLPDNWKAFFLLSLPHLSRFWEWWGGLLWAQGGQCLSTTVLVSEMARQRQLARIRLKLL